MSTCTDAQKKHVLHEFLTKETPIKKKLCTATHMEKNPNNVEVRTCVHVHKLKEITALRSGSKQPQSPQAQEIYQCQGNSYLTAVSVFYREASPLSS